MKQQTAEQVFYDALDRADPVERRRYLEEACNGDTELQSQVEALLQANEQAEHLFPTDPREASLQVIPGEVPGACIGRYKLLEQIGEGGFGVVFMAEQEEPIRRKVALKVIKLGMDTRQVIARFEAERQALALMDHPNIAKVLDAGTTGQRSEVRGQRSEVMQRRWKLA